MKYGISLSAIGKGRDLQEAIAEALQDPGNHVVEIAIGAKPVTWPALTLSKLKSQTLHKVEFRAHHALPVGKERMLRPESESGLHAILDACSSLGIKHYSMHPPVVSDMSWTEFEKWARVTHIKFLRYGIHFSLETMFRNGLRTPWLSNYVTLDWAKEMDALGWKNPLVVDLAHLQIAKEQRMWTAESIHELLESDLYEEVHYSSNDGKRDTHRRYAGPFEDPQIADWIRTAATAHPDLVFIDEGRRR